MTFEELQNKYLELAEENRVLKEDKKALETKLSDTENNLNTLKETTNKRIQELQEHNQKLFLRVSHQKEEKTYNEDFKSELLGDYANFLDDNEKEILRELEGGL